ncbi:MAG: penicillin-binding transpeptidase domain-containing protein [Acidobacteriota bacterium]
MSFSFIATLLYLLALGILVSSLLLSLLRSRPKESVPDVHDKDFGPLVTSRRLTHLRRAGVLLFIVALGFHAYWALLAAGPIRSDGDFALLKNRRDQRNRREVESQLRGWIFDRHHDIRLALAKYRYLNGEVIRDYPLGAGAAHLVGYSGLVRGDAMIERAVSVATSPPIEPDQSWWSRVFSGAEGARKVVGRDLILTVDFDLQKEAAGLLAGKSGAIVILNPQTGDLLALASAPAFDPDDVNNDEKWREIARDIKNRPLLNRALDDYYLPGSTLKLLTASAALEARLDKQTFTCRGEGWVPPGSTRPIRDDDGEAHGQIGLADALTHSCNQYFAQLGVEIDRNRLGDAARRFGLRVFDSAESSLKAGSFRNLWNTDNQVLSDVLAPLFSTFVAGRRTSKYDLGLESIGQGFVQVTPLQMAMVVSSVANKGGNVMQPKVELNREPAVLSQSMTPETAAQMRTMMSNVVTRGTASAPFSSVRGRFSAGGKTGTAQRQVPVIDPKTEKPVTYRDSRGVEHVKKTFRIDSWFVGFAPLENPQVAIAVVVEGGGYGARNAAPIAVTLLAKAQSLGLLNSPGQSGTVTTSKKAAVK